MVANDVGFERDADFDVPPKHVLNPVDEVRNAVHGRRGMPRPTVTRGRNTDQPMRVDHHVTYSVRQSTMYFRSSPEPSKRRP